MTTLLVTGATGTLGAYAARTLRDLDPAADVVALVRPTSDPRDLRAAGLDVRYGDYDDPTGLPRALAGVDRLLLVSSPVLDPVVRLRQHRAVLDAAARAGVAHVVYTSALGAEHDPGHLGTEQALAAGRASWAVLRNGLYTEPFATRALVEARCEGVVRAATGRHELRTVSVRDLAEAAARALLHQPADPRVWHLNGPGWTYDDLAAVLADRLGRPVRHLDVTDAELGAFGQVHALFRAGLLAQPPDDLVRLLGRRPATLADCVDALS